MPVTISGDSGITTPDLTDTGSSTFVFDGTNLGLGTASPTGISGRKTQVIRGTTSEVILQSSTATDGTNEGITVTAAGADAYYVNRLAGAHIWTGGSGGNFERMRINAGAPILCLSGGNTSATGTGITFPATQSASSDANTLDDYEEGTWTPTLIDNGFNNGATKIGRCVTIQCILVMSTPCRPTTYLRTGGNPFSSSGDFAGTYTAGSVSTGRQGGFVFTVTSSLYWSQENGTTNSSAWFCTITYFV